MLTALDENKYLKVQDSLKDNKLLLEFRQAEAVRRRDFTPQEIWAAIESDEEAYNPSAQELDAVIDAYAQNKQ